MAETNIEKINIQIETNADTTVSAMNRLSSAVEKMNLSFGKLNNVKQASTNIETASKKAESSANGFSKLAFGFSKLAIVGYALNKVGQTIGGFINSSNSYIENLNLFTVAMGKSANEAKNFIDTFSAGLGVDPSEAIRNIAIFQQMSTGFGIAGDKAYIMSKNLTQLGYDLSSFFNLPISESMTKLQSGIAGELEPLRRLGFALDEATLRQTALNLGIDLNIRNMTQAQKAQLRYVAIMQQSTNAQGDLARTLITPANAIRILQQQFTLLARSLGNLFIPALTAVLPYLIAVVKVATMAVNALGNLIGFKLPEINYDNVSSASSAYDDLADSTKKATSSLAKFDEINTLSQNKDTGIGAGGDLGIDLAKYEYDALSGLVGNKIDEIVNKIKDGFGKLGEFMKPTIDAFEKLWESLKPFAGTIGGGLQYFYEKILKPFGKWAITSLLPEFFKTLSELFKSLNNQILKPLGEAFVVLWESIGSPIANVLADIIIASLKWIQENSDGVVLAIFSIATAFGAMVITKNIVDLFKLFSDSKSASNILLNAKNVAIMASAFAGAVLVLQSFVDVIEGNKNTWETFGKFLLGLSLLGLSITLAFGFIPALVTMIAIAVGFLITYIVSNFKSFWAGLVFSIQTVATVIGNVFIGVANFIIMLLNSILLPLNLIISGINMITGSNFSRVNIPSFKYMSLPKAGEGWGGAFASGGFPESGSLFLANEAGPEFVGNMGGRTAVANNDQIVSGIAKGVYQAVVSAMSQTQNQNQGVDFIVNGKSMARATIQDYNNEAVRLGYKPILQRG